MPDQQLSKDIFLKGHFRISVDHDVANKPYRISMCYNLYRLHVLIYVQFKNFKKIPGKKTSTRTSVHTNILLRVRDISITQKLAFGVVSESHVLKSER